MRPKYDAIGARLENKQPWVDEKIGEIRDAHIEEEKVGGLQEEHLVLQDDEDDGEVGQESDNHDQGKHCKCDQTTCH